jgi:hypothetical protein
MAPVQGDLPQSDLPQSQFLRKLQQAISSAIAGLSADHLLDNQWNWHPPGKWCAAEVLEHLYLTYTGTIKGFERLMAAGKVNVNAPTWWQRMAKIVVIRLDHMPSGRESPARAKPRGLPREKVLTEIASKIAEMDEVLSRCERELGSGPLLDHPIIGPLTAAEWKKFHLVHGMHHVRQIHRLREGAMQKK